METRLPKPETRAGVVAELRKIREQFSLEIMNMSFEELRAYMDEKLGETAKLYQNNSDKSKQNPAA